MRKGSRGEGLTSKQWFLALITLALIGAIWGIVVQGEAGDPLEADTSAVAPVAPAPNVEPDPIARQTSRTETLNLKSSVVRGRLVDVDGHPLAVGNVDVSEHYGGKTYSSARRLEAKGEGVGIFEYPLKDLSNANRWFLENGYPEKAYVLQGLRWKLTSDSAEILSAEVRLSAPDKISFVDLGDVQLTAPTPFVRGRVVDGDGNPLDGAWIRYCSPHFVDGELQWNSETEGSLILTNEDGCFADYKPGASSGAYWLRTQLNGYESSIQDFEAFGDDLSITLIRRPRVSGTVLTEGAHLGFNLRGVVVEKESEQRFSSTQLQDGISEEDFYINLDAPISKPFHIEVQLMSGTTIFTSQEYLLHAGQEFKPPELNPLDLRGKLHQLQLTIVDTKGKRLSGIIRPTIGNREGFSMFTGGTATILYHEPVDSVVVTAEGYAPVALLRPEGEKKVVLKPAVITKVQIPAEYLAFKGGYFRLSLPPNKLEGGVVQAIPATRFDEKGFAQVDFPAEGEYRIGLTFEPFEKDDRGRRRNIAFQTYAVHSNGQVIQLYLDPAELAKIE